MEALELWVGGDLRLIEARAGQTFLLNRVGQSTRDKDRWKRLNDIVTQPTLKLVVQLVNDRRMARYIGNGLDSPSSGDFGAADVFAHTAVRLPSCCGLRSPDPRKCLQLKVGTPPSRHPQWDIPESG